MNHEKHEKTGKGLVPRLRFPQFRDEEEWQAQPLDSVSQFVKKKIPLNQLSLDTYVSTENLSQDYGGIEQASKLPPNGSATEYKPDDILIANIRPYLKKVWRSNRSGGASNDVIVIRPKAVLSRDYLPMVIANDAFINYVMTTAKGVKMPRGDIASIKDYVVHYPTLAEQQKIADCLGALDGLFAAEGRKLTALRDHKRGLMQQLFPQPDQTQPRLRFPEFRDMGEWETLPLGRVVEVASGQVDPTKPPYRDLPHIGGENIESHTGTITDVRTAKELQLKSGKYAFNEKDVLYSKIRPVLNKVAAPGFKGICSADIYPIRPSNCDLRRDYLVYLLLSDAFLEHAKKHSDRTKIPKVNRDTLLASAVSIPISDEQQNIAACLISVDNRITAQAEKIESLKQHKRGLMQQLFPVPEEP